MSSGYQGVVNLVKKRYCDIIEAKKRMNNIRILL